MAYVIYDKETTKILRVRARSAGCYVEHYKSEAAAKAALTRLTNKGKLPEQRIETETGFKTRQSVKADYAIAEIVDFRENIEKKEIRHGVAHAHGQKFEVGVNTPWTSGPWSETYFCS